MYELSFTIMGRPITKKNSQQIVTLKTKNGKSRPIIVPSKAYKEYEGKAYGFIPKLDKPIEGPVNVRCLYFMQTNGLVDLANLLEATCDVLTHYKVLSDDNSRVVVSHDGSRVYVDKLAPRVEVSITGVHSNREEKEDSASNSKELNNKYADVSKRGRNSKERSD